MIFVFGSNTAGRHMAGAAHFAVQNHGAVWGQAEGMQGNSYAIPTVDERIRPLPVETIAGHVNTFIQYAKDHPSDDFQVTAIGCGIAGFKPEQIGPLFKEAPVNCVLPEEFLPWAR